MSFKSFIAAGLLAATALAAPLSAQDRDFSDVQVTSEHVRDNIHVLFGAGGNIGVSVGADGVFLIDDQFAPLTDKIRAAVTGLSDKPIRFVVNTHYHGDHTGGNENLGKTGTVIVAHDNVYVRLSEDAFKEAYTSATPTPAQLPVVTFNDKASLRLNGDNARIIHLPNAHTDTDSIIHFKKTNVLHMGDTFFANRFPFIHVAAGGSINGLIAGIAKALSIADNDTKIIPGHGPVSGKAEMIEYYNMLLESRDRVAKLKASGMSLEDIQKAKPLADMDAKWQTDNAEWPDRYVGFIFESL